jgi:hypothetical protein
VSVEDTRVERHDDLTVSSPFGSEHDDAYSLERVLDRPWRPDIYMGLGGEGRAASGFSNVSSYMTSWLRVSLRVVSRHCSGHVVLKQRA